MQIAIILIEVDSETASNVVSSICCVDVTVDDVCSSSTPNHSLMSFHSSSSSFSSMVFS
jgi:hypothetical protein